jgi:hypothetical protein
MTSPRPRWRPRTTIRTARLRMAGLRESSLYETRGGSCRDKMRSGRRSRAFNRAFLAGGCRLFSYCRHHWLRGPRSERAPMSPRCDMGRT